MQNKPLLASVQYGAPERASWRTLPERTLRGVDLALMALKVLTVAVLASAILVAHTARESFHKLKGRAENPGASIVLRYPEGWSELPPGVLSLGVARRTVFVWLQRMSWTDLEAVRTSLCDRCAEIPFDGTDPVSWIACFLRIERDSQTRVVKTRLGGRRAIMIVGPRSWDDDDWVSPGWGAVVVAAGSDLLFMHIYAPDLQTLDAVWEDWLTIGRGVRVTDREPVRPIFKDLVDRQPARNLRT